jgi:predicted small lipoprotein YifL
MPARLKIAAGLVAAALALSACGVRGNLDLPPDAKAQQAATATSESGQGKAEGAAPSPHKGFILDGLLR